MGVGVGEVTLRTSQGLGKLRWARVAQLSEILDSMPKDGTTQRNDDEYLCDKEVAYMLKVSRRTLSEYRSNGTLPYYVLGGKVLYKRSEIEQALKREYNGKHLMNNSG